MLKICLCDDDLQLLGKLTNKIEKWLNMNECIFRIQTFNSGEQLVFHMEDDPNQFDIIILDIIMGKLDGIEAAKKLRQCSLPWRWCGCRGVEDKYGANEKKK